VLLQGKEIPEGMLAAGAPAEVKKPVSGDAVRWVERPARVYQHLADRYGNELRECS
jgi:carbonic anhydrase/acetyltransferase-like protein (isoleucine patch superfamily)